MKAIEMYFWCALYWAFYLPISLLIMLWTEQGDVLGILLVGFILTAVLVLFLLFEDGALIPDELEPAIILRSEPAEEVPKVEVIDDESPIETPNVESKPKRKYVRKKPVADSVQEHLEVEPDEKKEQETERVEPVGVEPEPRMRTDVDLGQLDAPDDSIVG